MAKILYEVKQNKNTESKGYGMWYGRAKALETLNTLKLFQYFPFYDHNCLMKK